MAPGCSRFEKEERLSGSDRFRCRKTGQAPEGHFEHAVPEGMLHRSRFNGGNGDGRMVGGVRISRVDDEFPVLDAQAEEVLGHSGKPGDYFHFIANMTDLGRGFVCCLWLKSRAGQAIQKALRCS